MHTDALDIAGAARFLLDSCAVDGPMVDPFAMAEAWGLNVLRGEVSSLEHGQLIVRGGEDNQRRFDVAHELGHILARHTGLDPRCEQTASAIAAATLLPDAAFKRDLDVYAWDLKTLTSLYGVSYTVAVRRITELRGAVVSVWEQGKLRRRWRSPWLHGRGFSRRKVPRWENSLAAKCLEHRCHTSEKQGFQRAYWLGKGRVLVVSEVESWESCSW